MSDREWVEITSQPKLRELYGKDPNRRAGLRRIRVGVNVPRIAQDRAAIPLNITLRQAFDLLREVKKEAGLRLLADVHETWFDLYVTADVTPEQRNRDAITRILNGEE